MALTRPLKEGSVTTYQQKVALGFKDILASEADGDHDTMYAAWNGALGGDLSGNLPNPTVVAAAKSKWTVSGATLTPTDATKTVSVPGGASGSGVGTIILGSTTIKARLQTNNASSPAGNIALATNRDAIAGTQDDTTKPSWQVVFGPAVDQFQVGRQPGAGAITNLLTLDNTGNLTVPATAGAAALTYGTRTIKGRLQTHPTADSLYWSSNALLNAGATAWAQDDVSKASWVAILSPQADQFLVGRVPAGGTTTSALLTLDSAGTLTLTNGANVTGWLSGGFPVTDLHANNGQAAAPSKTEWAYRMDTNADAAYVMRRPSAGTFANMAIFLPTGDFQITGSNAYKATGTAWINPSDPRLKQDIAPYAAGLAEIIELEPIAYKLRSQPDGPLCYGFDAAKVRDVFPECISEMRMKLDPADEEETDGVLSFDMHPILVALVNAVRELAEKIP